MNAVLKRSGPAEYFRCGARCMTISRAWCAAAWRARDTDTGGAACRACPEIVREAVLGGGVELVTAEDVRAGLRPRAVGETMEMVPGELRESPSAGTPENPQSRAPVVNAERQAGRMKEVVRVLRGEPWQSAEQVGRRVGVHTNNARRALNDLVASGDVTRDRPIGGGTRRGSLYFFALAAESDAPLPAHPDDVNSSRARIMRYLARHPGSAPWQIAMGTNMTRTWARMVLSRLHAAGDVELSKGAGREYRWAPAGELKEIKDNA